MDAKNEKIRQQFSERLKKELARVGLPLSSPTKIATEFNRLYPLHKVAPQTMRKWLFAEAIPTQAKLLALAGWLEVSPEWLRFGMGSKRAERSKELALEDGLAESRVIVLSLEQVDLVPIVELLALLSPSNIRLVEGIVRCVLAGQGPEITP